MSKLNTVKQISFSDNLLFYVEERLGQMGVSFPEYIRYLVLNDTKEIRDSIKFVSANEEKQVADSIKDLENGDFTIHDNGVRKYFENRLKQSEK